METAQYGAILDRESVLTAIGTPDVRHKQAEMLLKHADSVYPKVSTELADALYENRNETLLQYLLDAARDPAAPLDMRNLAIAGKDLPGGETLPSAADILKEKAIPRLRNILLVDDPKSQNFQGNRLVIFGNMGARRNSRRR